MKITKIISGLSKLKSIKGKLIGMGSVLLVIGIIAVFIYQHIQSQNKQIQSLKMAISTLAKIDSTTSQSDIEIKTDTLWLAPQEPKHIDSKDTLVIAPADSHSTAYYFRVSDNILSGKITTTITKSGLVHSSLDYSVRSPMIIERTATKTRTLTKYLKVPTQDRPPDYIAGFGAAYTGQGITYSASISKRVVHTLYIGPVVSKDFIGLTVNMAL